MNPSSYHVVRSVSPDSGVSPRAFMMSILLIFTLVTAFNGCLMPLSCYHIGKPVWNELRLDATESNIRELGEQVKQIAL